MEAVGYVEAITTRDGVNKNGKPYTMYNVKLVEKTGDTTYVGFGFNPPSFKEGQWIKAVVEQNGQYLNYKGGNLSVADGPAPAGSGQPSTGRATGGSSGGSRNEYWENKEKRDIEVTQPRIQYQAARKDAVQLVSAMLSHESLPISVAQGKTGESKRYEQILDYVEKLTVQFYQDTESLRVLDKHADAGTVETETAAPLPTPDYEAEEDEFSEEIPF